MLAENHTAIVTRNETWQGVAASEPYEAGWAREAVVFVRALKAPVGAVGKGTVQISPDGMHWTDEGSAFSFPAKLDDVVAVRVAHFGNWLRVRGSFDEASEATVLISLHLKG